MKRIIQVRISRGEQQYVAECLDLPVVTQAHTLDELAGNIREAVALQLDGEGLAAGKTRGKHGDRENTGTKTRGQTERFPIFAMPRFAPVL